jgi:hypothetical protein
MQYVISVILPELLQITYMEVGILLRKLPLLLTVSASVPATFAVISRLR